MKGPGLFSDIGKKAKDLLTKDYSYEKKLTVTTHPIGRVVLTTVGVMKGGIDALDVFAECSHKESLVVVKADADLYIKAKLRLLDNLLYAKAITAYKDDSGIVTLNNSAKLKVQYFHDQAALSFAVALKQTPEVDLSASFDVYGIGFGAEVGFETSSGAFTKYNVGVGLKKPEHHVTMILADKGDTLRASYVYHLDEKQKSSVVAEINRRFSTNKNSFIVGGAYALGPQTTVKARLNNSGKLGALIQREVRSGPTLTLSGEFETKALDMTPKFGLTIAVKPC